MPPLIPRRRSRRRAWPGRLVLVVCALVALAVVVGGFTQISRQSGPYNASLNRSFAAQGSVVARESSATASTLRTVMATMAHKSRRTLQAQLDGVVLQAGQQSVLASTFAGSGPGGSSARFAQVFADRATAATQVRAAIDGLLGMHPLPVAGESQSQGARTSTPTLLTSTEATNRITSAGALLARADREYRALRRALGHDPGHARLPSSAWITRAQIWQIGAVATEVDQVATSSHLAAVHHLVLRTMRLTPQALPSLTGTPASVSTLSPTHRLGVSVAFSNLGSVDEPHAAVQFTLTSVSDGVTATVTRRVALASGASVALQPVLFAVKPGQSYRITVGVVLPAAQADLDNTSMTQLLQIAPGT